VSGEELERRRAALQPWSNTPRRGYLLDFAATAAQAHHGCVSRALHPACQ
jgi:dihydroxyacid dehydratase/phosphogluconate dehydratase